MRKIIEKQLYPSEYAAWRNAKTRCFNKNYPLYKDYGGRGIIMCEEWRHNFLSFLNNVGIKPDTKLTLDRIDNNKGYEPNNCRWVSMKVQCNNRRKRKNYEYPRSVKKYNISGFNMSIKDWDIFLGYKSNGLCSLRARKKISYEEAIKSILMKKYVYVNKTGIIHL